MANSKGEAKIAALLKENRIPFKQEFTFPDLKWKGKLKFDFAIFNLKEELIALLEYDGEQHFQSVKCWGGDSGLKKRQELDRKKNRYCLGMGIKFIRIPYWKLNSFDFNDMFNNKEYLVTSIWHNDLLVNK